MSFCLTDNLDTSCVKKRIKTVFFKETVMSVVKGKIDVEVISNESIEVEFPR